MAKQALGRGLGAIFEEVEEAYNQELRSSHGEDYIKEIELDSIKPNPFQPRLNFDENALKELSNSIQRHGLLQPILVVKKDDGYMLLAGERRLRASKLAGLEKIKAIVADIESDKLRELALIENIQREDLNPIELAKSYNELINEYKITQDELSQIIQKSRTQITNTLRLLLLSNTTQKYICDGRLSQGHAKIIVGLSPEDENRVVQTIIGQKLSVRETEFLIRKLKENKSSKSIKKSSTFESIFKVKDTLKDFGYKVKITENTLHISFQDDEEVLKFFKNFK